MEQLSRSDDSRSSYTVYNEHIARPAPILITAKFGGLANSTTASGTRSKLLCLSPSQRRKISAVAEYFPCRRWSCDQSPMTIWVQAAVLSRLLRPRAIPRHGS
ncbi:hypothetical protein V2A60_004042 [Cordyceps javanica]